MGRDTHRPLAPASLVDTEDRDPEPVFSVLRAQCPVAFDEVTSSWLVTSYDGCRDVFSRDIHHFAHPDRPTDPEQVKLAGGPRQLKFLTGKSHRQLHRWWLRAFSPKSVATMQAEVIRPIVHAAIDRVARAGHAELWADLAARVPVRVVAAVLDLPHQDEEWIGEIARQLDIWASLFNKRLVEDDATRRKALAAAEQIMDMLLPTIRERRAGTGTDLISRLWRDGPGLLDNWSEDDVVANTHNLFVAGKDSTTLALANALYLLLTEPALFASVGADPSGAEAFVEESLRLLPPVQYRVRIALEDMEIEGVPISAGDTVVPVMASAGRDPHRWGSDSHLPRLDRALSRSHLAFAYGPRTCVGAALARAEMHEVARAVVERLPDIRLDTVAGPPRYQGLSLRSYRPLPARFTPVSEAPLGGLPVAGIGAGDGTSTPVVTQGDCHD